jgi:hypothetical protein
LHVWNMVLACNQCNHTKDGHIWTLKIPLAYGNVEFPSECLDLIPFDFSD